MQRVAVARAIVARPRIILAYEPTGNLDSQRGHELLELLSGLVHEDGLTAVIATHATDPLSYATRRVRMRDGRIREGEE
jgi:putative ABC transport system ATP-binding protein